MGHPAVLARLGELAEDEDEQVAAAAQATQERLREPRRHCASSCSAASACAAPAGSSRRRPGSGRWPPASSAFLLIQSPGAVPEDALFDAFWADRMADTARQHLAVAISRARKVLDLPGAEQSAIEIRERTYRLALRERDSVDAIELEVAAAEALADRGPGRRASLRRAAALWTGEPLPEDRYAEWSTAWRERPLATYSEVLGALIQSHSEAGEQDLVIRVARQLLDVEQLNEAAHRSLMVAYARTGRTSHALRQYLECRHGLVAELGVEPAAETADLQARILASEAV